LGDKPKEERWKSTTKKIKIIDKKVKKYSKSKDLGVTKKTIK
jgi:hypothetical protein